MVPNTPCPLVFTALCKSFPHCTGWLPAQQTRVEMMICHFWDSVIRDCSFCLGFSLLSLALGEAVSWYPYGDAHGPGNETCQLPWVWAWKQIPSSCEVFRLSSSSKFDCNLMSLSQNHPDQPFLNSWMSGTMRKYKFVVFKLISFVVIYYTAVDNYTYFYKEPFISSFSWYALIKIEVALSTRNKHVSTVFFPITDQWTLKCIWI